MPVTASNFSIAFLWRKKLPQKINYKAARVGGIGLQRYHHADIRVKNPTSCSGACYGKPYVDIGDCCSES
ncbi:MAG: hypothetical protein ACJAWI_001700 [Marinomonas primoryensis]|jgi:hypothetical protein